MTGRRRFFMRILLAVGGVLAAAGLVAGHVNRHLLDGPTFAAGVDELRRDEDVARLIGTSISTQLILSRPDLVAIRPLIDAVAIRAVGGDALSGPVRRAATAAHVALTESDADSVVLRIADAGAVVQSVLAVVAPERAPNAAEVSVTLASVGDQSFADATISLARSVGILAWLLPALALMCLAAAVFVALDRWSAAAGAGWALVVAAASVGVILVIGGNLARRLDADTLGGAVGRSGWNIFVRPLWWGVVALAVVGGAVIVACSATVPDLLRAQRERVRSLLRRPRSPLGIAARATFAGVVGVAAIADPSGVLELAAFLGGLGLVLFALVEIADLADANRPERAASSPTKGAAPGSTRRRATAIVAGAAATILAVGGVVLTAQPGGDVPVEAAVEPSGVCNGHAELCERAYDDVAYVASHNAMSVARNPGWFLAEQIDPITEQLDQGVRVLLIDVWSGRPAGTVVRTAASSYEEALAVAEEELGPDIVAAAGRIADSVAGVPLGPEALFMCHGLCETGSTPFLETLVDLRDWLTAHPSEVVTLFIENHVDPESIAADVIAADLVDHVHTPEVGEPWPTLGEMIASGERLVAMLEDGDGGDAQPWLVNGFEFTQETPYTFPTVESFSCEPNRGPSDAPLLLLNHWLSGFSSLVTNAQLVNTREVLLDRAERCRDERGQIPNFVAVNFSSIGDVHSVVDVLNAVE